MKKTMSALLPLLIAASVFAACGESSQAPSIASSGPETTAAAAEETGETAVQDFLPENDYGGFEFNIISRVSTSNYALLSEEQNGDMLNDAKYARNMSVSERFNIVMRESEYTDENVPANYVLAGDDTYSLMNVRCTAAINMMLNSLCYDMSSLPYIDLTKPYWDAELSRYINIRDKSFVAIGSSNLMAVDFMMALLFNKELVEQYNIGNLYDMVREGKWTFDAFGGIASQVSADINGDGKMDKSDQWGALGAAKLLHASFIPAANAWYIKKDADNMPVFEMETDEYFHNVFNKVTDILTDNGAWYKTTDSTNEQQKYTEMFRNGQGLFMSNMFYYIASLRDMDIDFGILPYPKYDEAQDRYYGRLCFFDTAVVPVSVPDPEISAVILEALSCESYNSVVPAYKDVVLKSKFVRDEDSSEMIDVIMQHRILDYGDSIYASLLRDGFINSLFMQGKRDLMSKISSNSKKVMTELDKLVSAYNAMEG